MIEVSDLYDEFYATASQAWDASTENGRFRRIGGLRYDEVVDQLELDTFLVACAQRLEAATGEELAAITIARLLVVCDTAGRPLRGKASEYHSHGFDYAQPGVPAPSNLLIAGDLVPRPREAIRLFLRELREAADASGHW